MLMTFCPWYHLLYALQELYDACDRMRPQLFRLASSATEDGDEGLGEIKFAMYDLLGCFYTEYVVELTQL